MMVILFNIISAVCVCVYGADLKLRSQWGRTSFCKRFFHVCQFYGTGRGYEKMQISNILLRFGDFWCSWGCNCEERGNFCRGEQACHSLVGQHLILGEAKLEAEGKGIFLQGKNMRGGVVVRHLPNIDYVIYKQPLPILHKVIKEFQARLVIWFLT